MSNQKKIQEDSVITLDIIGDIINERKRQRIKYDAEFDSKNTSNDWVSYITRHAGQAVTYPMHTEVFKEQMIKVATLAIAAIEQLEKHGTTAPRHYD